MAFDVLATHKDLTEIFDAIGDVDISDIGSGTLTSAIKENSDEIETKVSTSDIANNLTTTDPGKVLDARQGKILGDDILSIFSTLGLQDGQRWTDAPADGLTHYYYYEGADTTAMSIPAQHLVVAVAKRNTIRGIAIAYSWTDQHLFINGLWDTWRGWKQYYTKADIDNNFYTKSDISNNFYTKNYINGTYYTSSTINSNYYNRGEVNNMIGGTVKEMQVLVVESQDVSIPASTSQLVRWGYSVPAGWVFGALVNVRTSNGWLIAHNPYVENDSVFRSYVQNVNTASARTGHVVFEYLCYRR